MYTSAFPAVNHADWNKSAALLRNIDKLRDRIKALESAAAERPREGQRDNSTASAQQARHMQHAQSLSYQGRWPARVK